MKADVATRSSAGDSEYFTIDLKGDRHNLTYGATHRYAVPAFVRAGRGHVLGADKRYVIDRDHRDTDTIILCMKGHGTSNDTRTKSTKLLSRKSKQQTPLYRLRPHDRAPSPLEHEKNFLPLGQYGDNSSDIDSGDERHAYRSIYGKAKEEDDVPNGAELLPDEISQEQDVRIDLDAERKARSAQLSRAIDADPTDVASWLKLIDHQDLLVLGPGEEKRALKYAERRSVAEVKLSLYDKALKKVDDSPHKDRLLLGRLHEGAQIWDSHKLLSQWKTTLENNAGFIGIWVGYLDFRQTNFAAFTFEDCMATFLECLNLNASHAAGPQKIQIQCYLFLRLTLFLREAGYLELAVGLWQAVLEFICFRPASFVEHNDVQGALSSFAAFWESEVARIGDSGATGWGNGPSPDVDSADQAFQVEVDASRAVPSWTKLERDQGLACRVPSRSVDAFESDADDPYTVVLFSDLQDILPLFWGLDSSDELIDSFLYFCHLPHLTVPQNVLTTRLWDGDNFVRNEYMDSSRSSFSHWVPPKTEDSQASISPFSFRLPYYLHTTDSFFASSESWFSSFQWWSTSALSEASLIDSGWVRRTLRSLVELHTTDDELAEYVLALEFACDCEGAKKFAKRLLKSRSSNLRLYNAFALMQWRSGAESAANHVWSTALSMSEEFRDYDKTDRGLLWNSWLWSLLSRGDLARATHVLNAISSQTIDPARLSTGLDPVQLNATGFLRLQSVLRESQEQALAFRKSQVYTAYTDCLALFQYLMEKSFEAALGVYASAVLKLRELLAEEEMKAFTAELLHQARARLVHFHIERKGKFKPSQIHSLLKESTFLFHHNTIFLSLFMWNESRFPIFDRIRDVRDLIKSTTTDSLEVPSGLPVASPQNTPISTHLFSIYNELCRPVFTGSTAHSARAAFEKAIGDHPKLESLVSGDEDRRSTFDMDSARSNLTIWKLYILFELDQNRDIEAAKAVFYRAIRACPWSKELIMLAFEHLRDDLIPEELRLRGPRHKKQLKQTGLGLVELRQLYNVLIEKRLRVHVDAQREIAEFVEQQTRPSEQAEAQL